MTTVLMALSAARHWTLSDGTQHPTGFWAEEFVVPYTTFVRAGYHVTVATPGAVRPVVDELSLGLSGGLPSTTRRLRAQLTELERVLQSPMDLHAVDPHQPDLVFYPGGHGPMEDLAVDRRSGDLLRVRMESARPIALLCHAPAAVLATVDEQGASPFQGRRLTGLSNLEERVNPFAWKASWLLQDRLRQMGVTYERGTLPFRPHVVVDGTLYSGQNPQSSQQLAQRLVSDLR